ncbi:MAG TPA: SusC/RagA family TonB-linked outer membrane protein, partial [Chitinophagaceae bacterium]
EVKLQPVGSFDKILQGKVPGLLSQSQSGSPGRGADVTIRGNGSINGTNTPLYVIDGVQVTAADFSTINPGDIESYTVLKDAASTSIYGSRGANGVIVVTTKRGRSGQTLINYDFQYGYSQLPKNRLELMNSREKLQYEFYDRPDGPNPFGWSQAEVDSLSLINYDHEGAVFRKGMTQQHQLSASGGNDKTKFFISGSIFDQQGIVKATGLKRYTGRFNIDNTFSNFKIGLNATFGYSRFRGTAENNQSIGSPLNAIRWFRPYISLYDANGDYQEDEDQGQPNPLQELLENIQYADQMKGIGNVSIEYSVPFARGLKVRTSWGGDFTSNEAFGYFDRSTATGQASTGTNGRVARTYNKTFRYTGTTSVSYTKAFGDHDINLAVFNEIIQGKTNNFNFTGFGLVGPFKNEAGITPGTPTNNYIPVVGGGGSQSGLLSYFFDGSYGFKKKYYVSVGARRDGSSRLSKDKRWANFGSVGLSWIVSDESFMQNTKNWLSSLKYKISYGSAGSQGIGDFTTRQLFGPTVYNGVGGLLINSLGPDLTWERKNIFNTGIEFTLFKGRAGGTIEAYRNITNDLFLDRQLSRTSGFQSITNNLGKLRNQGIEVSLNATLVRTRDVTWSVEGNYTYNQNKLLDQNGLEENVTGLFINKVGESINTLYVVRYAGVDPATGDALYYKKGSKNTTNVYDPADRELIGSVNPPHFGGFSTTFNWKGLTIDVAFSYIFGAYAFNNDRYNVELPDYYVSSLSKSLLREWQNPGDITDIPSPFSEFHAETTRFVEKTDHLRLRNVMLSYDLPKTLLDKLKIRSCRFFAQGQNLHVWHNFQGYDPEITTGILGGAQYPQLKTVTVGLSLGL